MPELIPRERLQPALLDRLTDQEPYAKRESRDKRVISLSQFRAAVLRDLAWLLNTGPSLPDDMQGFPEIEKSVLNYGVSNLTGRTAASLRAIDLEQMLVRAIQRYEPRILARTLKVRVAANQLPSHPNTVVLEIQGDLWAQPLPEALYIKTQVDLETGHFSIEER